MAGRGKEDIVVNSPVIASASTIERVESDVPGKIEGTGKGIGVEQEKRQADRAQTERIRGDKTSG